MEWIYNFYLDWMGFSLRYKLNFCVLYCTMFSVQYERNFISDLY